MISFILASALTFTPAPAVPDRLPDAAIKDPATFCAGARLVVSLEGHGFDSKNDLTITIGETKSSSAPPTANPG